jgi:hypothetical protein
LRALSTMRVSPSPCDGVAGRDSLEQVFKFRVYPNANGKAINVGIPHDERDARHCGFPSLGASMRAISVAILGLPDGAEIHMGHRVRGERPINLIPQIVQVAFAIHQTAKPRMIGFHKDTERESRALAVINEFKIAGGDTSRLLRFYRDEFDEPHDVGFRVLERAH